jgi:vacuolar-type H+-ATPase subunit C/Vma6
VIDILFDPYSYPFWILISLVFVFIAYVMGRPFLTYVKFNYPTAKFEAMGNPYIKEQNLSSIVETKDIESFKELFHESKDYHVSGDDVYSIQQSLDASFVSTVEMMKKDSSKSMNDFFDVYLQYCDSLLMKHSVINFLLNKKKSITANHACLDKTKQFLDQLKSIESDDISALLTQYGLNDNDIAVITKQYTEPFVVESVFNSYVITKLSEVVVPYKCEEAKQQFIKILLDVIHLKLLLRCKQLNVSEESCKKLFISEGLEIAHWKFNELTELENVASIISSLEGTSLFSFLKEHIEVYNKQRSVQVFEVALHNYLLEKVKQLSIKYYSSIGPTIRFLVSKEFEIMNLKIIVKGISEDFSKDMLKQLLVSEVIS